MQNEFKSGFVNIFGPPNAGKSTLLNALLGESLAIISPKVQTTRHRILGIKTEDTYQIVFSDTPGIIDPKYKLHNKMMQQVKSAVEDTDVAILLCDIKENVNEFAEAVSNLRIKTVKILIVNKIDTIKDIKERQEKIEAFKKSVKVDDFLTISAIKGTNVDKIIPMVLKYLPESPPFFPDENISDRPVRFFVSELVREQIYFLYGKEIPYHSAVLVQKFEELSHVTKIQADIIVTRETQKLILLGQKGSLIKKLGTNARLKIEEFLGQKVYLELYVKVRPKWRDNDLYLKEYGY